LSDASSALPARHLSPRLLAIRPLYALRQIGIPMVLVLFFGRGSDWSLVMVGAGLVYALAESAIHWARFTYRIDEDSLQITRGLLERRTLTIPLDRVRGVDVSATPLHRITGLAVVRVDAAAHQRKDEAVLDAVLVAEAAGLRSRLLHRGPALDHEAGESPAPVLARLRPAWVLYSPLAGDSLLALAAVAWRLGTELTNGTLPLGSRQVRALIAAGLDTPLTAALLLALLVALLAVVSTAWFAVVNWDFTLRAADGSLVSERGLLTRRSVSLERRRVRGWELLESPLERLASVGRLRAIVTGLHHRSTASVLLPIGPRDVLLEVAGRAVFPFRAELLRHPPAALRRRLVRATAPWLVAAATAGLLHLPGWLTLALLALAVLGVPLGIDRHRALGHAGAGGLLAVREGSLRRRQAVIESRGVVGWRIHQTWFQRRAGLATLIAGVGAGRGGYPIVDVEAEEAVGFARSVTPGWLNPLLEVEAGAAG
jgi:putative membrane protein